MLLSTKMEFPGHYEVSSIYKRYQSSPQLVQRHV